MPPKKDDKKGKKGGAAALKEIDPSIYVRKQTPLAEVKDSPQEPNPLLTGFVQNVEQLFPEWSIEGEVWTEPIPEGQPTIVYPKNLHVTGETNFTTLFGLEPVEVVVDPKAKGKKEAPKKGAKEAEPEIIEQLVNADGKQLPVMFKDSESEFLGCIFSRDFARNYTAEELAAKTEQESLQKQIDELKANSPEESAKEIHRQEEHLRHLKAHHDFEKCLPSGPEVDPYIVAAYRTVLRFAPIIIGNAANHSERSSELDSSFLWRSVYPKLPNGKPIYNSSGKYAVRLFLAGKWRKVYVSDVMPTREDGSLALASSSDRYELWPMILAKAIYTVFSVCGYAQRFQDCEEGLTPSVNYDVLDTSHPITTIPAYKISQFVAFVVHLLVGWQPANPIAVANTFVHEKSKSVRLVEAIVAGGVHPINKDDIINDDDVLRDKRHFHSFAEDHTIVEALKLGSDILDNGGQPILKTKKVFQQEYLQRKKTRDDIVARILKREEQIQTINQLISTQSSKEVCTVAYFDHETGRPRIFNILGLLFPETSNDLLDVQLLIDWRTAPAVTIPEEVVSIGGIFQPDVVKAHPRGVCMRRDDEPPLPQTTPLIYEWVSISQLVAVQAFVITSATNILTPFTASYSRHWQPLTPVAAAPTNEKGGKGAAAAKGKDKAGAAAAAAPSAPAEEVLCGDEGVAPLTFLTVDTTSFFAAVDAKAEAASAAAAAAAASAAQGGVDDETALALAEQEKEMEKINGLENAEERPESPSNDPPSRPPSALPPHIAASFNHRKEEILYLQVMIHADMVTKPAVVIDPTAEEQPAAASAAAATVAAPTAVSVGSHPPSASHSRPASSHGHSMSAVTAALMTKKPLPAKKELPSDIVMILEEVRTDDQPPLMFILDLKDTCFLPVIHRTFGVPQSRLTRGQPFVFWIRLFSKSSFFINFSSAAKIVVDDAEKQWSSLGREIFVSEGDAGVTRENTEQLLFRMPLLTTAKPPAAAVSGRGSTRPESIAEDGEPSMMDEVPQAPPALQCKTFFYINDRDIERHVILKLLDPPSNPANTFSRLHQCLGNILNLHHDPKECNTLIGTLLPAIRSMPVRGFHWKLLVIAEAGVPIVTPVKPINEEAVTQRYNSRYFANNKLSLFRDVYSIEKSSFPIALRLNLSELPRAEGGPPSPSPKPLAQRLTSALIEGENEEDAKSAVSNSFEKEEERLAVEDMHIVVRMYRKSDKKLVSEFRGKKLCLAYTQSIDGFLNEGEESASPAAAAAAGKKDAKPPAKGKAAPTADTIDIIVECQLDTSVEEMTVLPHLKSRFPHVFDALYDSATSDASAAHESLSSSLIGPTIDLQNGCLSVKPPTVPQFQWQLDILAGKVASISHDLTALEQFTAAKNAWETASAGRTDRAQAALAYYQERRKIEQEYAAQLAAQLDLLEQASTTSEKSVKALTELTATMIENLVTALDGDQAVITERYKRVRALPAFSEEILYLEQDEPDERMLLAPENDDPTKENRIHETAYERREKERVASHQRFTDICAKFAEYNVMVREETKARVSSMAEECVADLTEMSTLWPAREAFRLEAETRNASLNYILNRSKVAVQKAVESEVVVDDPKKKGKKK